jgi:hypothetical protein
MVKIKHVIIIFIILFIILCVCKFFNSTTKIIELNDNNKLFYHDKIVNFENKLSNWYPIGNDYFKIDHGNNYYSFFERLGNMNMVVAVDKDKVVGTGCGILRNIQLNTNYTKNDLVWYICDLKIDPKYRGKHIPLKMLTNSFNKIIYSNKIYAITMDNKNKDNKILRLAKNIPIVKFKNAGKLMIYSVDYETLNKIIHILNKHRGPISYLSLNGTKDLTLKSNNEHLPILHLQWGNSKTNILYPIVGYTYMFCCPRNDPMYYELKNNYVKTNITATIIQHSMDNTDWKFILTSDI